MRLSSVIKVAVLLVGLTACLAAVCSLVLPISSVGPASRQAICTANLKQIAVALANYHHAHGCFPPAYLVDSSGNPMHSWRALILKDLAPKVYEEYNFQEPWDGPNNRKLAARIPSVFVCPNDPANRTSVTTYTSYVAIVGPRTVFPGSKPTTLADLGTTPNRVIHIAEVIGSDINWMEPRDLDLDRMSFIVNTPSLPSISSKDPNGPAILLVDGTVKRLREPVPAQVIRAMVTIDGSGGNDWSR